MTRLWGLTTPSSEPPLTSFSGMQIVIRQRGLMPRCAPLRRMAPPRSRPSRLSSQRLCYNCKPDELSPRLEFDFLELEPKDLRSPLRVQALTTTPRSVQTRRRGQRPRRDERSARPRARHWARRREIRPTQVGQTRPYRPNVDQFPGYSYPTILKKSHRRAKPEP